MILISVDTLRADHLSCYDRARPATPHIDALAKNGTLFSQVDTPFPLTLPAHVALFTSTYPFANGVQDNGIPLRSSTVTLATIFKNAGYQTGAFVGSFVLDRRFGLSRGFDIYDGPLEIHGKTSPASERKRPGRQVAEAAEHWLERHSRTPFFLFLHLYDLHKPYDLQPGYDAELAYVDQVLGDFLAFLERRALFDKALIIFTSDHGEGLGDHGESTHGFFIYQSTLHVPLVIHWPSGSKRIPQDRVEHTAGLLDVAPTILEAIGMPRPAQMRGRSLFTAAGDGEVYSESVYARNHFGCAPLRSLRIGEYKYIEAPKPELYNLSADPGERRNIYEQQRARATSLAARIAALRSTSPAGRKSPSPSPETVNALRSLGYLSGPSSATRNEPKVDPKDRIGAFEQYSSALSLASAGKLPESEHLLERLSSQLPDVIDIRMSLGENLQVTGETARAAAELKRVIQQAPSSAQAHFELGSCYLRLRQPQEAIQQFKAALALEPWYSRADEALADLYVQKKDYAAARTHLNHLLSVDPHSYTAHYNLGILAATDKNWNEAQQHILAALRTDSDSAEAHNTLGNIYLERGELEPARRQFEEAIRLQTNLASAHYSLGLIYQKQGNQQAAAQEFQTALDADRAAASQR